LFSITFCSSHTLSLHYLLFISLLTLRNCLVNSLLILIGVVLFLVGVYLFQLFVIKIAFKLAHLIRSFIHCVILKSFLLFLTFISSSHLISFQSCKALLWDDWLLSHIHLFVFREVLYHLCNQISMSIVFI
jgi:hypothetical protein